MKNLLISLLAIAVIGCGNSHEPKVTTHIEGTNALFNSEDFDLETVIAMIKANKIAEPVIENLQKLVNDPKTGINNVDINKDGKIDLIAVNEVANEGGGTKIEFLSMPGEGQEPVTVAQVAITKTSISGGYPEYAHGHDRHYYHHPISNALLTYAFLRYALAPHPYWHYRPYGYYGYAPQPVMSRSVRQTTRTTHRTTTKVGPRAKPAARPASYSIKSAQKSKSRYVNNYKDNKSKSLSSRKGQMKSYSKRDPSKAKKKGTAFGAKPGSKKSSGSSWNKRSSSRPSRSSSRPRSRPSRSSSSGRRR